ncbi:MAG TPA: hypothetical protein VK879_22025, partial [Candidatus Sulfomarinibacteraceae bacterium]|nr:hypothetical protein [Candidatus Sulfomarinibacteraceae bacterium]
ETLDLSAYAGSTVYLAFEVATDGSLLSSQFLDNVAWYTDSQAEALLPTLPVPQLNGAPEKSADLTASQAASVQPQGAGDDVQCWYLHFKNTTPPEHKTFLPSLRAD